MASTIATPTAISDIMLRALRQVEVYGTIYRSKNVNRNTVRALQRRGLIVFPNGHVNAGRPTQLTDAGRYVMESYTDGARLLYWSEEIHQRALDEDAQRNAANENN